MDVTVTFNSVLCTRVGLELIDSERPLLAESKSDFVSIPHKPGEVVIYDDTKKDSIVKCEFAIVPLPGVGFYDQIRQIRDWLTTRYKAPLVFSDDPNYQYNAIAISNTSYERIARYGTFNMDFKCDPYEVRRGG